MRVKAASASGLLLENILLTRMSAVSLGAACVEAIAFAVAVRYTDQAKVVASSKIEEVRYHRQQHTDADNRIGVRNNKGINA